MSHGPKSKKRKAFVGRALTRALQSRGFRGVEHAVVTISQNIAAHGHSAEYVTSGLIEELGFKLAQRLCLEGYRLSSEAKRRLAQ